ncbi:MAG TPA: single-stranded DNA-binding protein [Solirubrobacterales bacterium]|nr:single-stranded DNA-binding protein [Solirubrobacterales bacterium]
MQDINTITVSGRLTRDPELRHVGADKIAKTTARLAIQRPNGKEAEDRGAAFIDVDIWRGNAEALCRYQGKGKKIAVEGRIEHEQWEKDGDKRQRTFIVAERVHYLEKADNAPADGAGEPAPSEAPEEAEPIPAAA